MENDLLKNLNDILKKNEYDLVKYKINVVSDKGDIIKREAGNFNGEITLEQLLTYEYSEPAWAYAYKLSFFKNNKFLYPVGRIHEDFGLTPYILVKAANIYAMNCYGYNYVQRVGSIVNGAEKNLKRCTDMLYHFDNLYDIISKDIKIDNAKKVLIYSYLANGLIMKAILLQGKDLNNYVKELRKRNVFKYLLSNSLARKVKKLFVTLCPKIYIKFIG